MDLKWSQPDLDFREEVRAWLHDNAGDNIQNHGGIGFTEECDAHLYLRRWRALDRFTTLTAAQ